MADQVIHCPSACTITLVHDVNIPILNMNVEDAGLFIAPITLVFCAAWGIRALLRVVNTPEKGNDDV